MKILSLKIRNFAGILEADIKPGKITVLSGKNRQGKTSILNAVRAALEGAAPDTIHQGAKSAELFVDLEEITVDRRITPGGQRVEVLNAEGFKRPAPQTYLSGLLGTTQFNPMEFHRAKRADRTKMLLEAVAKKVTFEEIIDLTGEIVPGIPKEGPALVMYDLVRKHYYALRHGKNKELVNRRELARTARAKVPEEYQPDTGLEEKAADVRRRVEANRDTVTRLQAEKKAAEKAAETRKEIEERIARSEHLAAAGRKELTDAKEPDVADLRKKVEDLQRLLAAAQKELDAAVLQVETISNIREDVANLERGIASDRKTLASLPGAFDESLLEAAKQELIALTSETTALEDEKVRQKLLSDAEEAEAARDTLQNEADALDEMVIRFRDDLPAQALREANLPIEGLKIDGDDITVNGIPIDNLSGAEKMGLALDIARALAADKPLKWIGIDGAEQLDEESFKAFKEQAEKDGFQYFVSRVGDPREGEIEVSGGKVASG